MPWSAALSLRIPPSASAPEQQVAQQTHIVWSKGGISILNMAPPSIFYHYTSKESLEGILASNTIFCSTPHPATPGLLGGYVIKSGVFLTRMDPNNSKAAIAFNNYR